MSEEQAEVEKKEESAGHDPFADRLYSAFLVVLLSLYAFTAYAIFSLSFGIDHGKEATKLMSFSFLFSLPISVASIISYLLKIRMNIGFAKTFAVCCLPVVALVVCTLAFAIEGIICVIMALPIFLTTIFLGTVLGWFFAEISQIRSKKLVSMLALAPFLFVAAEHHIKPSDEFHHLQKTIFIESSAEDLWPVIMNTSDIKPEELSGGYAYGIGVPYPVGAKTELEEVGGIRKSKWQKGVSFDEVIVKIEKNKYIEWTYNFDDSSFPPGSLDDHIKIGGVYFDLENTSYTINPENGGISLTMDVTYRVTTNFNWYSRLWADFFIGDTMDTLLKFYKTRAEKT